MVLLFFFFFFFFFFGFFGGRGFCLLFFLTFSGLATLRKAEMRICRTKFDIVNYTLRKNLQYYN